MAKPNPKGNGAKLAALLKAWKDLRPNKSFASMTLAQFTAKIKPSLDARETIDTLNNQLTAAADQRDTSDIESMKQYNFVINSIKGDPEEGEDGELYESAGFVRKSERKSGLTKKKKKDAPPTP